jgi:DNA replication protein DnaC
MMTVAAIDRLVHHADIHQIEGDSYRKKAALKRNSTRPS